MKLGFSMDVKQTQKMHLTKELKQAIDLLQMNTQEVELLIEEELNENPVLEANEAEGIDWAKFVQDIKNNTSSKKYEDHEYHETEVNPENFLSEHLNLFDHLEKEILGIDLDAKDQNIAYYIIERVNDSGYFLADTKESASDNQVSEEHFLNVLYRVQGVEPAGLVARNLKECLSLQIGQPNKSNHIILSIINNDLEDVAMKKYPQLQKKYKISEEELRGIINKIKSLDPKPGKQFSAFIPSYILPDIIIEKNGDHLEIVGNNPLPSLYISDFYQKILTETTDKETHDYIKDKLNRGVQLIRNIDQRKNTIRKVAEQILLYQKDFFDKGKGYIVPMKLKDIAEETGFHESTISRTVNGKYMLTPKGMFEFKYFFTTAISTQDGQEISNKSIKNSIKNLIKEENKKKPLSDQKLCDILKSEGIQISRRTVTKYREELVIPGSSLRKEL